ncbi:hypothetical protein [Roseococcus sp. DSY-14]|uniref:hypothetical protein n=1 Tax=Roseococcus sp. DSY-14 TaxID=3369650 RepID=UPI00387AC1F7
MDIAPLPPILPSRPAGRASPPAAAAPESAPDASPGPNPRLRVDPALNLLVVEFRGAGGEVTRTSPTEQELRAYRAAQLRGEDHSSKVMPRAAAAAAQGEAAPPAAVAEAASRSLAAR